MTLVSRVSAFILAALAVCLAGYSLSTYWLIRRHLVSEFDLQLQSALNVLVAAVEVEDDGVKWQPTDHTITLGDEQRAEEVRWMIVDEAQRTVDRSRNLTASVADRALLELGRSPLAAETIVGAVQQHLEAPHPKTANEREPDEFAAVLITVARDETQLQADLLQLTLLVCLLPLALLAAAAIAGRRYCRRALLPLGAMAARARSMTQADFRLRLPGGERQDELADLAGAFNGLLDQLEQAYERQHRFTGDAAHQLRTPLTVLRGQLDVALRRPRSAEEYRTTLDTLRTQTAELQQIVEAMLFLARSEGDSPPPETEDVILADWLPAHLEHWQQHPRSADLAPHIDPAARVRASLPLLGQALDNLISNALKYSPPGTPVLVSAQARNGGQDGATVVLSVEDQGSGIPAEDQEAIFEPFFRSAAARQSGITGTGLGLAIVARIAAALGGRASCDSELGHGSRFALILPSSTEGIRAEK